ncbi:MAG: NINE protein [Planctomycetota bacterium]
MRSVGVAYLLWIFGGWMGAHRFYLGQPHIGLLYLFTYGCCGIGWLVDGLLIPGLVEEANAGAYRDAEQRAFFARVKHDFRPQVQPTRGLNPLALILGFLLVICMMCFMCFMGLLLLGFRAQEDERDMAEATRMAREVEAQGAQPSPSATAHGAPSAELRRKYPELDRLHVTHHSIQGVIKNKIDPRIQRLEADEVVAKRELRALRPQVKTSKQAAFKAKKYLEELKEVQAYLKRMRQERERYEQQALELEMAMRKMERALEVSEVLGDDKRSDLKKLLARGEALVEEANKGFDKDSLEHAVGEKGPEEPKGDLDPAFAKELEQQLGED